MKREEFYDRPEFPRSMYSPDEEVTLPVTKAQFETLLKAVAIYGNLCDVDDDMRQVLAGWVHHIPNTQSTVKFQDLVAVLHKSVSNHLTWQIDQDIKAKKLKEAKEAADKAKDQDNVLNMPPRGTPDPGMDASS